VSFFFFFFHLLQVCVVTYLIRKILQICVFICLITLLQVCVVTCYMNIAILCRFLHNFQTLSSLVLNFFVSLSLNDEAIPLAWLLRLLGSFLLFYLIVFFLMAPFSAMIIYVLLLSMYIYLRLIFFV
jgi:hypothetical protein